MVELAAPNISNAETGIFENDCANTMAAVALAIGVARASAPMALNVRDKPILVFYEDGFELPVLCQC